MTPLCPLDYSCSFTPLHPRVVYHTVGPWWQHTAGWIVAIVGIIAIAIILGMVVMSVFDAKTDIRNRKEKELERRHKLAIEEQRTMQADMAKGNPEMLRQIRGGHE